MGSWKCLFQFSPGAPRGGIAMGRLVLELLWDLELTCETKSKLQVFYIVIVMLLDIMGTCFSLHWDYKGLWQSFPIRLFFF